VQFIQDYRRSIKSIHVEEPVDLFFYRPLAYLFVLVFTRTSITPNQISLISMVIGIISGCFLAFGDRHSMIIGGCLFGFSNVIDCSDGMVARIKKNGSKTGRIVDGAVDYIVGISVYIGFALGLVHAQKSGNSMVPLNPWLLTILAGAGSVLHAVLSDKYRNLYESHVNGKFISPQSELAEFEREYARLKRESGSWPDIFLIRAYLHYCRLQAANDRKPFLRINPVMYARYNNWMVLLWNLIGPAMHISLLMLSAIMYKPLIFFWYAIVWANLLIVLLYPIQAIINRKLSNHIIDAAEE
jgi:phosphatidylglycerophosphate synthase